MQSTLIGDKAFYRKTFSIMLPILAQNVITNFVNLLDNLMVGQVGTEPMSYSISASSAASKGPIFLRPSSTVAKTWTACAAASGSS